MAVRKLVRALAWRVGKQVGRSTHSLIDPPNPQTSSQPVSRSVTAASKGNLDPVPHAIVGVGDTGVSSGGSSSACVWRGNQLTVLNTKQVRELAVQAATGGSGEVVVLQKFIKPSGPNPWIQRGVWRKGRAPHAWVITNKVRGRTWIWTALIWNHLGLTLPPCRRRLEIRMQRTLLTDSAPTPTRTSRARCSTRQVRYPPPLVPPVQVRFFR